MRDGLRRHLLTFLAALLVVVVGVHFWGTAVSTAWARLSALQTVEPYAWAVHEQLLYNFAHEGAFFQTIHKGYDDAWTWSGHRAITLPLTALIYGLAPHPLWLAQIQIVAVLLGAIPAGLLGWRALGQGWGLAWGALLYLLAPPTMALALQDYQDLVYALPFLTFTAWAMGSGRWWLSLLGAVVAIMPREECVPMGIALAVLVPPLAVDRDHPHPRLRPRWRLWLLNVAMALGIAAAYTVWAEQHFPLATSGHDMPLQNALAGLSAGGVVYLEGWAFIDQFYTLMWAPLGFLALLCPELALPAAALILLHMTVPTGHGVDRSWGGHCHHMAPALAFLLCAQIQGGGRAVRLLQRLLPGPRLVQVLAGLAVVAGLLSWQGQHWRAWARDYDLISSWSAAPPVWRHPAWTLVASLPDDAIPVADRQVSIAISNRRVSYTYDESLQQKSPRLGMGAATHLIVNRSRTDALQWGLSMAGAQIIAEADPYVLITWTRGAVDPNLRRQLRFTMGQTWTGPYRKADDIPGVPPHQQQRPPNPALIPALRLPR